MKMTTCSIADSEPQAAGAASTRSKTCAGEASTSRPASAPAAAPARSRSLRVSPVDDTPGEGTPKGLLLSAIRGCGPRHRLGCRPGKDGDQGCGMNELTTESEPAFHLFLDA